MDAKEVQREFLSSIRRVDKPKYVREELPQETDEVKRRQYNRKYLSYVAGVSETHIRRRPK
jgi:hypothetical protein